MRSLFLILVVELGFWSLCAAATVSPKAQMVPVFSAPNEQSTVLGFALAQNTYFVIGQQDGWINIRFYSGTAWIKASEIERPGSELKDGGSATPLEVSPGQWVKTIDANVLLTVEPSRTSNGISFLPQDHEMVVLAVIGPFLKVRSNSTIGYVPKNSCVLVPGRQRVSVSESSPGKSSSDEEGFSMWGDGPGQTYTEVLNVPRRSKNVDRGTGGPALHRRDSVHSQEETPNVTGRVEVASPPAQLSPVPAQPASPLSSQRVWLWVTASVVLNILLLVLLLVVFRKKARSKPDKEEDLLVPGTATFRPHARFSMSVEQYSMQGEIGPETLSEVFMFVIETHKTGCLMVDVGGPFGAVYFEDGIITHAYTPSAHDKAAVEEILSLTKGQFRFQMETRAPQSTTQILALEAVMNHAKTKDETAMLTVKTVLQSDPPQAAG